MAERHIIPVNESHNKTLLGILNASPMQAGKLRLCFDKSPDIFTIARLKYKESLHLGFMVEDTLKGFGSLGYYDALIDDHPESVFSFYHFYLLPEARGMGFPDLAGKKMIADAREKGARCGLSVTLKGNRATESYMERRQPDWAPGSVTAGRLVVKSILFGRRRHHQSPYMVTHAGDNDIPDIVRLLQEEYWQRDFGIPVSEEKFTAGLEHRGLRITDYYLAKNAKGEPMGVCLARDCSSFRRTRVLRYAPSFIPDLLGYRILSRFWHMAPFPKSGECFRELTITDIAVKDRDPGILHALLSELYHRHHNGTFHFMNFGTCSDDPLLNAAKGFWCRDIPSHLVATCLDPSLLNRKWRLPYVDIAYL